MSCLTCNQVLVGKQIKYCSYKCKVKNGNRNHQLYGLQQKRGKDRKIKLIQLLGGKCNRCGYNKNYAALQFHHINPKEKSFNLDLRKCSNSSWNNLLEEAKKCELLCANCHFEHHNPNYYDKEI